MSTREYFAQVIRTNAFCSPDFETHGPTTSTGSHDVTFHFTTLNASVSVLVMPSGHGFAAIPVVEKGASR